MCTYMNLSIVHNRYLVYIWLWLGIEIIMIRLWFTSLRYDSILISIWFIWTFRQVQYMPIVKGKKFSIKSVNYTTIQ